MAEARLMRKAGRRRPLWALALLVLGLACPVRQSESPGPSPSPSAAPVPSAERVRLVVVDLRAEKGVDESAARLLTDYLTGQLKHELQVRLIVLNNVGLGGAAVIALRRKTVI